VLKSVVWAVAASLLAAAVATGLSFYQTPTYQASVKILVDEENATKTNLNTDVAGLLAITPTVAALVTTKPVAQAVVEQLPQANAGEVLKNTSVEQNPGTLIINVSYQDSKPKRAQQVANAIGEAVSQRVPEVLLSDNAVTATVYESATLPHTPAGPHPLRNGLVALMVGLMLSAGLIAVREYRRGKLPLGLSKGEGSGYGDQG
jgi:capsular polysaccharide biosynthesis protein